MLAISHSIASFQTSAHASGRACSKELMTNELNDDTRGTTSEPLSSRDSRWTCDSLRPKPRHDRLSRVPAHRLRVQTSPTPNRSNCPRWRASEYCSAKAGCSRAFPNMACYARSRTVGRLCRARQRVLRGRLFKCLPQAGSSLRAPPCTAAHARTTSVST